MSFISQFINRFYHRTDASECRIVFGGVSFSGKTTLLYLLKSGEFTQVYPTLAGFNVENFVPPTMPSSGAKKKVSMTGWDLGVGCGMQYLYGILAIYIKEGDALLWMVDSTSPEMISESVHDLGSILSRLEEDRPTTIPILVLANKQDLPNAKSVDGIRIAFSNVLKGRLAAVYPTSTTLGLGPESGLPQAFDWLDIAIPISRSGKSSVPQEGAAKPATEEEKTTRLPHEIPSVRSPGNLAQRLNSWLGRVENASPPDEFLSKFDQVALPEWDHYTHIRLAFLMLRMHGRQKGKDMIFEGIKKYISESKGSQTTGRSFHFTMTVHDDDLNEEFARFLIVSPFVVDGQLWMDYYSKEVMMGAEARDRMVLPDKKPLPSVAARDQVDRLVGSS